MAQKPFGRDRELTIRMVVTALWLVLAYVLVAIVSVGVTWLVLVLWQKIGGARQLGFTQFVAAYLPMALLQGMAESHSPYKRLNQVLIVGGTVVAMMVAAILLIFSFGGSDVFIVAGAVSWSALGLASGALVIRYFLAGSQIPTAPGLRMVSAEEASEILARLERLAALMDLPAPRLAVLANATPNAFAVGYSPRSSVIVLTSALTDCLHGEELDSVLAHELSHIAHRDAVVMTIAGHYCKELHRQACRDSDKPRWNLSRLMYEMTLPFVRGLSCYRELAADRAGALATGNPSALASALVKIQGALPGIPKTDLRQLSALNALCIMPAPTSDPFDMGFRAHPSLRERLAYLAGVQRRLDGVQELVQPGWYAESVRQLDAIESVPQQADGLFERLDQRIDEEAEERMEQARAEAERLRLFGPR